MPDQAVPAARPGAAAPTPAPNDAPTVAMLYPGYAAEGDYPLAERLLGAAGPQVRLPVVHTSQDEDAHRIDALLDLGNDKRLADGAARAAGHRPQAVVWACTSGSFVFGWEGAHRQVRTLGESAGVPASSTSLAFARAAAVLGVRQVAIAATYPADVAEAFRQFLAGAGVEVTRLSSEGIVTAAEVGTLTEEAVVALVRANDHPDAEAVLVPDTALHSIAWLPGLERAVGKPVLTANQVTIWEGLRLATGATPTCPDLGTLFTRPPVAP